MRARGRAALIPYITAGYPDASATRALLAGAAGAGADIVELGIPWSDPVADGPVIQASSHSALARGMTLQGVLDLLGEGRCGVPVILFSYLNPILAYGPRRFAERALEAGAAGVLVTDLPVGADPAVEDNLRSSGLPLIRLVAPTTTPGRLEEIAAASEGFVYLIARLGVTGRSGVTAVTEGRKVGGSEVRRLVAAIREVTDLPVAVGFGISEPKQAAEVGKYADGVVVGSALVERLRGGTREALAWLGTVREAMDEAGSPA